MIKGSIDGSASELRKFTQRLADELQRQIPVGMAINQIGLISFRVQQQGRLTSGALIGGGKYSPAYAKYRQKRGRQTAYIDLTLDGGMLQTGFTVIQNGNDAGIGFINADAYAKYEYNTQRFGEWATPSPAEVELSFKDFVLPATNDAINKSSK